MKRDRHKETLEGWLQERVPEIPPPFIPILLPERDASVDSRSGTGDGFDAEVLAGRAEECLARALQGSDRTRDAAFHLLAADAYLTYACEHAAGEGDVRGALEALLARIADRFA